MTIENVKKWTNYINGYKSYITACIFAVYELLKVFYVIIPNYDQDMAIRALILVLFGASIRHAISKVK